MLETQSNYNYKVVRQFAVMTVIWGIVGMLVGVIIAAQLVWPDLNSWHSLSSLRTAASAAHQCGDFRLWRLRAFATSYLRSAHLSYAVCSPGRWRHSPSGAGRLVIVLAAITLPMGFTSGKGTPSWNGRSTS